MFENSFIRLSGYGRLCDISCRNDEMILALNMLDQFNGTHADDIWLKCRVDMSRFLIMTDIEQYFVNEKSIVLKFDAKYLGFQQSYSEITHEDPAYIVQLCGELLNIYEFYIESENRPIKNSHAIHSGLDFHMVRV